MSTSTESKEALIAKLKAKYPNNPELWVEERHCSFCGIGSKVAKGVVAGPQGVLICNQCIMLAYKALSDKDQL